MRQLMAVALMCTLIACNKPEASQATAEKAEEPPTKPFQTYTMDQFSKTLSIGGSSFNKDETKLLVTSNETGIRNVYTLDLATGERTPVTESEDTTRAVSFFRNDDRIIFMRDRGGNENFHIYVVDPTDGSTTDITGEDGIRELFWGFSESGDRFFVSTNKRDRRFMDLHAVNTADLKREVVHEVKDGLTIGNYSRDERWLALTQTITRKNNGLYVLDRQGKGEPVRVDNPDLETVESPQSFSPDNRYLYYTTDQDHEFSYLKRYELATGKHEEVRKADWGVTFCAFSRKGTWRMIGFNWDGSTKLEIDNMNTGKRLTLPELPPGMITSPAFSYSERYLKFNLVSDTAPSNIYLYDFETGKLKRLTDTLNPEIDANHLVASELIRYQARDGLEIPAYLYKPVTASPENKVPALVWVHGGPGGQSRPGYSSEIQYLINHGYAMLLVNNRGSSGYGKTFFAADDRKHGKEPLWDCIDGKHYLQSLPWVDGEKIGIIGGSYGGYMVAAALAFEPEEFVIGVNIFGVTNWLRTLESIPPYWEAMRQSLYEEMGDPVKDRDMLHAISPLFHADKITRPMLVLQGANDPRVLEVESRELVEAIRKNNGVVEYVLFEDEGHGFSKNKNRIEGFTSIRKFSDKYLKQEQPTF